MKNRAVVVVLSAVMMTALAACGSNPPGSTSENPLTADWLATDRGDVYCLTSEASHGYQTTDCDWSTLVERGTHTTTKDETVVGKWLATDRGGAYCLVNNTAYGYVSYDCDWSTLGQREIDAEGGITFVE